MLSALKSGWSLLVCHKKVIAILYLGNLLSALVLAIPFMYEFKEHLGAGRYRQRLEARLDFDWMLLFNEKASDFAATFSPSVLGIGPFMAGWEALLEGTLHQFPVLIVTVGLVYLPLNSYLLGAAVGSFAYDPEGTTLREFLKTGGMYVGRFIRISLLALALLVLLHWSLGGWLRDWAAKLSREAVTEASAFVWETGALVFVLVALLAANLLIDYTRIRTALEDRTSVLLAFFAAASFCFHNRLQVISLYLALGLIGVAAVIVYLPITSLLSGKGGWAALLAVFTCQQIYMLGRISIKLWFYSSQLRLFEARVLFPKTRDHGP